MSISIFEQTTRMKLRFETVKGLLTVEDLWDLPLTSPGLTSVNLDRIAVGLSRQLKAETTESFVVKEKKAVEDLQLRFDVVKHIIDVKLAEREEAKAKAEAREKKDRILAIISRKQDQVLEGTSLEELQKMAESL